MNEHLHQGLRAVHTIQLLYLEPHAVAGQESQMTSGGTL